MALIKLLPTPSDRMGSIWNLLALNDAFVLEYGPAGTTHFGIGPLGSLNLEPRGRYFVTHMDENDVIMGDSARLERAVREIDEDYQPKHLFIIGSSVSSTIGTDLKGICFYLQDECQAKLHVFNSGGFDGDYLLGTERVYAELAGILKELPETMANRPSFVPGQRPLRCNLLGLSPDHFRAQSDLNEIERLLKIALGAELQTSFVIRGQIADLPKALEADCNLVLRKEALPLAEALTERGVPSFNFNPYGYQGSLEAVQTIAEHFGLTLEEGFVQAMAARSTDIQMLPFFIRRLQEYPQIASIGPDFLNTGLATALSEMGLEASWQLPGTSPESERLAALKTLHRGLIFADRQSLSQVATDNIKVTAAFPWTGFSIVAEHLPLMGPRGMDFIVEEVQNYLNALS